MYSSLLVPLDRSALAEQALPLALSIARRANAWVDLVEVHALYALHDATAGWRPYDRAEDHKCKEQELLYLDATAKWLTSMSPLSVSTSVLSGSTVLLKSVADSILERVRTGNADLIVMSTHARGRLSRLGFGSVADELIRRAPIPILVERPHEKPPHFMPEPHLDNILIPLDGYALAEQVLEHATDLAQLMGARCSLLHVVEPPARDHGPKAGPDKDQAQAYLECIAGRLRENGLQVRTKVVVTRNVADAILEEAEAQASNLIALATHGRGGLKRLLMGNVADSVVRNATSPVLVYRPTAIQSQKTMRQKMVAQPA
jgi:nucleotide-binding universal stress UspA family protein